jgi:hypothetical protein
MTTFAISNDSTDFGTFEGETPAHALAAMHRAAGYASTVVDGVVVPPVSAVDADGASLCPSIDDVTIAEVTHAGASITVHVGRDTIDPQGLGSDEECAACEEYILDAVRTAFPGATVRAVGNGGRTGGATRTGEDFTDEVKAVVTRAFDDYNWTGYDDQAEECASCGATHVPPTEVPELGDDEAWEALAEDHADACEWIETRAHRFDTRVVVDQENGDEEWWDAASADAGKQSPAVAALFARIDASQASVHGVCCRAQDAEALVAWATDLPGWGDGPEHAPNPLLVQPA